MKLYCGIDLHSSNNVVAVSDEQDRALYEKRLNNDLDTPLFSLTMLTLRVPAVGISLQPAEHTPAGNAWIRPDNS